jgi:ABC-type spermidine/putrescine transport system permease subunit II
MRANILIAVWSLTLATTYAWIAYTSNNNPDTALTDLLAGGLWYIPLLTTAITALVKLKSLAVQESCWKLLVAHTAFTVMMMLGGYNHAGLLFGIICIPLGVFLAIKTLESPTIDV